MAHFEAVAEYGLGDLSDQKTIDAICMRLSAGIEVLSGPGDADREALFGDVWNHTDRERHARVARCRLQGRLLNHGPGKDSAVSLTCR